MTAPTAPPPARPRPPSRGRPQRRPIWTWLLPLLSLVLAGGIPLLVWYAGDAIFNSADGELTETVTDPQAPGYEVIVNPSPSHMVLSLDPSGDLSMVTILSLGSNDIGGTVLHIPPETVLTGNEDYERIIDAFRDRGENRTRRVVADLIGVNVDNVTVLDVAGWSQLVLPAGSIPVDLVADLVTVDDDGTKVRYYAGNVAVDPGAVAEFLGWVNPGEHPGGRMPRQEAFWQAWLASVAASDDPGIVPGEVDSGIGRFIRGIARGVPIISTPTANDIILGSGAPGTEIDVEGTRDVVSKMIPFPLPSSPGSRPRVKLLDGVGGLDMANDYSPSLVRVGAQIVVLGNAYPTFGVDESVVIYHDPSWEEHAFAFSQALGGTNVKFEPILDVVLDVTIIIGEDQGLALGE